MGPLTELSLFTGFGVISCLRPSCTGSLLCKAANRQQGGNFMARVYAHIPIRERLLSKIVEVDGCWNWQGTKTWGGYGRIAVGRGQMELAHRISYILANGPIPAGLQIDHLCRNRACINPAHLEAVTCKENLRRGHGHGSETHCPQGHSYRVGR